MQNVIETVILPQQFTNQIDELMLNNVQLADKVMRFVDTHLSNVDLGRGTPMGASNGMGDVFRFRVGKARVLTAIDINAGTAVVLGIGLRK